MIELDKFEEKVRRCEYLAEDELKVLCEYVRSPYGSAAPSTDEAPSLRLPLGRRRGSAAGPHDVPHDVPLVTRARR